jgi:hypothetical protein
MVAAYIREADKWTKSGLDGVGFLGGAVVSLPWAAMCVGIPTKVAITRCAHMCDRVPANLVSCDVVLGSL